MRTEWLIYLDDISRTHSITQTAQRFFISQQALSFALKKLEGEFNTVFLHRTNHGVTLTPEGDAFLKKARTIIDVYYDLKEDMSLPSLNPSDDAIVPSGSLKILTHTRLLEPLLIDIIEKYGRRYPDVRITLQEKENIDILKSIEKNDADFGLIFVPEPFLKQIYTNNNSKLAIRELFSDDFILCCNHHHPFAQKKNINFESISEVPALVFDTNVDILSSGVDASLADYPSNLFYSNNGSFHKEMLRRGLAVSVITSFEFRKLFFKYKDLTAIPIENSIKSVIVLVSASHTTPTVPVRLFEKMLMSYDFYGA